MTVTTIMTMKFKKNVHKSDNKYLLGQGSVLRASYTENMGRERERERQTDRQKEMRMT